jgi:hypothetical protein
MSQGGAQYHPFCRKSRLRRNSYLRSKIFYDLFHKILFRFRRAAFEIKEIPLIT